ncbi:hypothetical protein PTSG_04978 [Salpingoeca rosetta]|uniref:EF-hand domain-containing protein n=1 Tax=Salpingoeca rosetta (strain ATCC 50818 / BSB-021) TaxID=946362 RepID=F2U962_SALR5|nr:uncharacterized protein PTSG_04978 [Salpingoeca rosetta]EGD73265.1 hypothetical protein PTSG_04978 [Salpingoeca rosetta]|eukprot:XP_004994296.1 hypothetical protein PTSG_04978 [Salpingoeca rosetta]
MLRARRTMWVLVLVLVFIALLLGTAQVDAGNGAPKGQSEQEESWIHRLMDLVDDDKDGSITIRETQDVINKELMGTHHTVEEFHKGDDERDEGELLTEWRSNPIRQWTTDQVAEWVRGLELDSCVDSVLKYKLTGKDLAHLAVSHDTIEKLCGSKEDRQRLKLRSLDAVLFGPGPDNTRLSYIITVGAVGVSVLLLLVVGYYDSKTKRLNSELKRVAKEASAITDLEGKVEQYEATLSEDAGRTQKELQSMSEESAKAKDEADGLRSEMKRLRDHQKTLRTKLKDLLQQSYEQETQLLTLVKELTQQRKQQARREAEKLDAQRRSVFGVLRLANSVRPSQCETEMHSVLELYELLGQVAKERSERWTRLQKAVGFRLVTSPRASTSALAATILTSSSSSLPATAAASPPTQKKGANPRRTASTPSGRTRSSNSTSSARGGDDDADDDGHGDGGAGQQQQQQQRFHTLPHRLHHHRHHHHHDNDGNGGKGKGSPLANGSGAVDACAGDDGDSNPAILVSSPHATS